MLRSVPSSPYDITCHHSNFSFPLAAVLMGYYFFGLTVLLTCPKAGSTFLTDVSSRVSGVLTSVFELVCLYHCVRRYLTTSCFSFFPTELQFFTPCKVF